MSEQLQTDAHRTHPRLGDILRAMSGMILPVTLRNQQLNFLAEQFLARVAKQFFGFFVDQLNFAPGIHDDDSVGSGFEQTAKMGFAAPDRLLVVVALDGDGNDIGHRLEKVDVLLGEVAFGRVIGAKQAERTAAARNDHRQAADDCVLKQVRRWLERQILTQVVDHHAAFALEGVTGLRIGVRRDCRGADVTLLPAHSGAHQQRLATGHEFEKAAETHPKAFPHQRQRRVEQRRKLLPAQRRLAQLGQRGLLPLAASVRRLGCVFATLV